MLLTFWIMWWRALLSTLIFIFTFVFFIITIMPELQCFKWLLGLVHGGMAVADEIHLESVADSASRGDNFKHISHHDWFIDHFSDWIFCYYVNIRKGTFCYCNIINLILLSNYFNFLDLLIVSQSMIETMTDLGPGREDFCFRLN